MAGLMFDSITTRMPQFQHIIAKKLEIPRRLLIIYFLALSVNADWTQTACPTGTNVESMVLSGSSIFAGLNGTGIYKSADNGVTWSSTSDGLPTDATINTIAVCGSYLFAGTYGYGVYVSSNNGGDWTAVNNGLPSNSTVNVIFANGTSLYAGTNGSGIYYSTDYGSSWSAMNTGLPASTNVKSIALNSSTLFIGTYSGLYTYISSSQTWSLISDGIPSTVTINALASNGNSIYAGTAGSGVYYSKDNGVTWNSLNNGLQSNTDIFVLISNSSEIFSGINGGVYHLVDTTWSRVNSSLSTNYNVLSLTVYGSYIFAGTGNGIWKSILPPSTPTNLVPSNNATNIQDSLVFSWGSVSNASSYSIQVSVDSTFTSSMAYSKSGITTSSQTVTGLTNNTIYYWRVSATNTGGTSAWSSVNKLTTTLLPPTQVSPSNKAVNQPVSITFQWNTIASATTYGLQIATDSSFASSIFYSKTDLSSTTITVSGLSNNTTYYWRVNATNTGGTSNWSGKYSFSTIVGIPDAPLQASPINGALGQAVSLVLQWNEVSSATSYTLQVSSDSTFASSIIFSQSGLTTGSQTISGLSNNTTYYWRVSASNLSGTGEYSQVFHFTTMLASPTPSSPANNAVNQSTSVTFIWGNVASATSYSLQVSSDSTFTKTFAYNQTGLTDVSNVVSGLSYSTTYYWRVSATNSGGTGSWSSVYHFTTSTAAPSVPAPLSPFNNSVNQSTSLSLSWESVADAVSYTIQVGTDSTFSTSVLTNLSGLASTSQSITGLSNNTVYYWRVNAANSGGTSDWSSVYHFTTTIAAPTLSSPSNNAVNQPVSPALSWSSVTSATSYSLQVATDTGFSKLIYNQSGLTSTSQTVTNLSSSTIYYWRVNATNANGTGNWSSSYKFTTITAVPEMPVLSTPLNNSVNQLTSLSLIWEEVTSAVSYTLQVSSDSTFSSSFVNLSGLTSRTQTISGLSNGTTYFWRVNATNTAGTSSWSSVFRFTTQIVAPSLSYPSNNATNQAISLTFSWNTVLSATSYTLQVATDTLFTNTFYNQSGLSAIEQSVTGLSNSTVYYWRVNATNPNGTSAWSSIYKFTTIAAVPDAPSLETPLNNAVNQSTAMTLSWNSVTSASSYAVQVATDSLFTSLTVNITGITSNSQNISGLVNGTVYYWRVNALNAAGSGAWSSTYKFTTTISVPVLKLPANNATNQAISLSVTWDTVTSAKTYALQVATDSAFSNLTFNQSGLTSTTQSISSLTNGTTYYWRVNATNAEGTGSWSTAFKFTTIVAIPSVPLPETPLNNALNQQTSLTLSWDTVSTAASYNLQVSTDSLFSSTIINYTGLTSTSQTISGLSNAATYYWRVNATNATGTSSWSAHYRFTTTLSSPVLTSPSNNAVNQQVSLVLSWGPVTTATSYALQVATDSIFSKQVYNQSGLTSTSQVIGNLSGSTVYYWRVNATSTGGTSGWSTVYHFTTTIAAPVSPSLQSPLNSSVNQATSLALTWGSVTSAISYTLQVGSDSTFTTSILFNQSGLTSTSQGISGLSNNTVYYWRVNAVNPGGTSAWSSVFHFTTTIAAPTPTSPSNNAVGQQVSLSFAWSSLTSATSYTLQIATDSVFSKLIFNQSGLTGTNQIVSDLSNSTTYYWRVNATNAGGTGDWSAVYKFTTVIAAPDAPVCELPLNNAVSQLPTLQMTWSAATSAVSYTLQVSTDSLFSTFFANQTGITAVTHTVSGLTNNSDYYWRVNASNTSGISPWSTIYHFKTAIAAPVPLSPENEALNQLTALTLIWNAVTAATSYSLQVANDSAFTNMVYNQSGLTSVSQNISGLSSGTTYFWRTSATNADGTSGWSVIYKFTTITAIPTAPVPESPLDNAVNQNVSLTLEWNSVSTASSYTLQVSADSTFASSVIISQTGLTSTSQIVKGLANKTLYYWRINASNSSGTGNWSEVYCFKTGMNLPVPVSPENGAVNQPLSINLNWSADAAANSYALQVIANDSSFSGTPFFYQSALNNSSQTVSELVYGTVYYWRVKAANAEGSTEWSSPFQFTTGIQPPQPMSPVNQSVNQPVSITFSWGAITSATSYSLQVSVDTSFSSGIITNLSGITASSKTVTGLDNNQNYYWRVNATCTDGTSAWSAMNSFTTVMTTPVLVLPADDNVNQPLTVQLEWNADIRAQSYSLQVIPNDSTFSGALLFNKSGLTEKIQIISGLSNYTVYYWRVNATNADGNTEWAAPFSFTTSLAAPTQVYPLNNAKSISTTPSLVWNMVKTARSYSLQVSADSLFSQNMIYNISGLEDTTQSIADLSNNTTYYWRVNVKNADGTSAWSVTNCFTTVMNTPILAEPEDDIVNQPLSLTLKWSADSIAKSFALQVCAKDSTFTKSLFYSQSGLTEKSQLISGLAPNTLYYWRVKAVNADGNTNWTSPFSFTTTLAAPAIISPEDNAKCQSITPTLTWNSVTSATAYSIQVSMDSLFGENMILNVSKISSVAQPLNGLSNNTVYYWRLSATNSNGTSAWSDVARFTTTMYTPELQSPENKSGNQPVSATFKWSADTLTKTYTLQIIAKDSTFSGTLFYNQSGLTTTSHVVSSLENSTLYYWRVKGSNSYGSTEWSSPYRFVTIAKAPVLSSPADKETGKQLTLKLSWSAVTLASSYTLQVSKDSLFSSSLIYSQTSLTATSQAISGLSNSTTYYWRVIAVNSDGSSISSLIYSFTTLLPSPTPLTPATDAVDQCVKLEFIWDSVPEAVSYGLQISAATSFSSYVFNRTGINTASYEVSTLAYNKKYYWRVNATNAGGTSFWSSVYNFKTYVLAPPQLISPQKDSIGMVTDCDFYWHSVTSADTFTVQISTDSTFSKKLFYENDSLTDTTVYIKKMSKATTYYWRVRAVNSSGAGEWSETRSFTTIPDDDDDDSRCGLGSLLSFIPPVGYKAARKLKKKIKKTK